MRLSHQTCVNVTFPSRIFTKVVIIRDVVLNVTHTAVATSLGISVCSIASNRRISLVIPPRVSWLSAGNNIQRFNRQYVWPGSCVMLVSWRRKSPSLRCLALPTTLLPDYFFRSPSSNTVSSLLVNSISILNPTRRPAIPPPPRDSEPLL